MFQGTFLYENDNEMPVSRTVRRAHESLLSDVERRAVVLLSFPCSLGSTPEGSFLIAHFNEANNPSIFLPLHVILPVDSEWSPGGQLQWTAWRSNSLTVVSHRQNPKTKCGFLSY